MMESLGEASKEDSLQAEEISAEGPAGKGA